MLGKQTKLSISSSPHLNDVRNFSNIHNVSLARCPLLSDISPLNKVPILFIDNCPLISDLSPLLGYHLELTTSYCNYELTGYHILHNIPTVSLRNSNIKDVNVLKNAKSISLYDCNDLVDITRLIHVKDIKIEGCMKVDLSSVVDIGGDLRTIYLIKIRNRIELHFDDLKASQAQFLPITMSHLSFYLHTYFKFFSVDVVKYFQNLQSLWLGASHDFLTEGLADIPHIELSCDRLTSISGLGRNREVRLHYCSEITDVSSLKDVPIVLLDHCCKIVDYSCLAGVPRLRVI